MSKPVKLTETERATDLENLAGWTHDPGRDAITRRFTFASFRRAWAFMSECALWAERLGHHPEWANVYNRVDVTLTTHDCDGLSAKDIDLAGKMDQIAAETGGT